MDLEYDDAGFSLGELRFDLVHGAESQTRPCRYPNFILVKTREMIDSYIERLRGRRNDSLLELGILRGGSVAFFNELLRPRRHMAIDIHDAAAEVLTPLAAKAARGGRDLLVRYDISQSDTGAIEEAYRQRFKEEPQFDLIIDDASHFYELSLASFNGLFRLVRPGGVYAIEDWAWGHWPDFQKPENQLFNEPALSNLVSYCVLGCAAKTAGVARVDVTQDTAFVYRNAFPIPRDFRIESSFPTRGRAFVKL